MTFGTAQVPYVVQNKIDFQYIDETVSPDQIIALGKNEFILLDKTKNELIAMEGGQIKNRIGGFGMGAMSFYEPSDMVDHNLQVRVLDRYDNAIKRFDHQLNFLNVEQLSMTDHDPFYPDLITIDPLRSDVVMSKEYGVVFDVTDNTLPIIDLNQFGITGDCIIDMTSDLHGNLAFLTCQNELVQFNRFGRLMKKVPVDISGPKFILYYINEWIIFNENGGSVTTSDSHRSIPLFEKEHILSVDAHFQDLVVLTNKRIIVLQ